MTHDELTEIANSMDTSVTLLDGLEDALIGYLTDPLRAVYDEEKCVKHYVRSGMSEEEAQECVSYNTERTCKYLGETGPILIYMRANR